MLFIVALYNTLLQKLKVVYFLQRNVVIIAFDFYLKFNGEYSHRNILQLQINGYCHQKYKVRFTDFFFNFSVNLKESGRLHYDRKIEINCSNLFFQRGSIMRLKNIIHEVC